MRRLHLALLALSLVAGCAAAPAQRSTTPTSIPPADQPKKDGTGSSTSMPGLGGPTATPSAGSFKPGDEDKQPATLAEAQKEFELRAQAFQAAGSDCVTMCKALASMRRAAEHICTLADGGGDSDKKRCTDAKEKVASAATKVKESCGGC